MPELPEVETIRKSLLPLLLKKKIYGVKTHPCKVFRSSLEVFPYYLEGSIIKNILRKGKILIFHLNKVSLNFFLLFHFGLTGKLIYMKDNPQIFPHTHLILFFEKAQLIFSDPRKFGWIELVTKEKLENHPTLNQLGPEPFDLIAKEFFLLLHSYRQILKAFLLDQKKIAGLGNIYTDEALFRAGLHPLRKTSSLSLKEAQKLLKSIKEILSEAIELGGSSVRNYVNGLGITGNFQKKHQIYQKAGKPCPRCGQIILYKKIAGRGTCFCPRCQK